MVEREIPHHRNGEPLPGLSLTVEPLPDLMVEHLKVLLVEHLKVMAALSVEPAYASYLANYLPTHPNPRRF